MSEHDVGVQADVTEQAYRYGDALGIGTPTETIRLDHTVMIMCDSTTKLHWWSLMAKGRRRRLKRVRCPWCYRMASTEIINGRT